MEKIFLEKLTEISKLLLVAHQKVEHLQKIFFLNLKRAGKLPGLEKKDDFKDNNEILK